MSRLNFKNIYTAGAVVNESDLYIHYHNPKMLIKYDDNYLEFLKMPTLEQFKEAAAYLHDFHLQRNQYHVKFKFPENKKPVEELIHYFITCNYDYTYLELFAIQPNQFPRVQENSDLTIQLVSEVNFDHYLYTKYQQDSAFGKEFANAQRDAYQQEFQDPSKLQILSYFRGNISGSLNIIIGQNIAEIDGLYVLEAYRNKGIASAMQQFIMNTFPDKTIIVLADGEDTPREMYIKQKYRYLAFQYEVQKVYMNQKATIKQ